ncbi:MAG: nickel-binding protein [Acidimicrobiia bacterium]
MPIYMDVHESLGEATPADVAEAHQRDLETQDQFGVRFLTYWFNDAEGKAFCLVESPDTETAVACHKAAHGLTPHRMIEVSGDALAGFFGEWQMNDGDQVVLPGGDEEPDVALRAIMFTDIVGSTQISSSQGDAVAVATLKEHDRVVRSALERADGREVKHTGDGILASFVSVTRAVECAIAIQQGLAEARNDSDTPPHVSIGISAGEPVSDSDDLFGAAVNLAARLCSHAGSDEILASRAIRDLTIGKQLGFADEGTLALKGFDDPVGVYRVSWR